MSNKYLRLQTSLLLDKLGAGNHKPGSGSAAALNGILSCKLLISVIKLTIRRKSYLHCKNEFEEFRNAIKVNICPRLEALFEDDALQFDKTILKRKERNRESNQSKKNILHEESLLELGTATEIPLEIAQHCIQLAKYAIIILEKGFKSARGDSGVAIVNSFSGIRGCISIISLNLESFPRSEWTDSIIVQLKNLKSEYDSLNKEYERLMDIHDNEANRKSEFLKEFIEIRKLFYGKTNLTYIDIQNLASRIQNALWIYRDLIKWETNTPIEFLDVLRPETVIKLLKYAFHKVGSLGVNERNEEIAGIINNEDFTIKISGMYKPEVINFTTAHELGHALFHDKIELHRDLPLDGSETERSKPTEEIEANKFAAFFLMPQKRVIHLFSELFQSKKFRINTETSFLLANCSVNELRKKVKTKRDLSRMIAKCNFYNYRPFKPLSEIFNVSIEAMAIRLEELDLIEEINNS